MPKSTYTQTNFTSGELSPKLYGRGDASRYSQGAATVENGVVAIHGGIDRRPGLTYVKSTKDGGSRRARIISYTFNVDQAFLVELGHLYARFYTGLGGILVDESDDPIEVVTPYTEDQLSQIKTTQGADTMLLFHPDVPVQRLQRVTNSSWKFGPAPFITEPFDEIGVRPDAALSISNGNVGAGRTFTTTNLQPPGAPTIGTASARNGGASVAFTPPANSGGRPIIRYDVTSSPGGITASGLNSAITVTGLTNGVAYTFTVVAVSSVGTSSPSAASNSVTPNASAPSTSITVTINPSNSFYTVPNGSQSIIGPIASATGKSPWQFKWTKVSGSPAITIASGTDTGAYLTVKSNTFNATVSASFRCEMTDADGARGYKDCVMTVTHKSGVIEQ